MPGETDVINVALRLIGEGAITSRTDGSDTANTVDDIYDDVLDDLLRGHNWNFATKRAQLAQAATAPTFEFDYAYGLPADWVRTISVHDNDAGYGTLFHRMEYAGNDQLCIVTSASECYLRYVAQLTDPNKWQADFRRAMSLALARDLAVPIAGSNTLQDQLDKQFRKKYAQAMTADAQGSFPELRPRGKWASARGGYYQNNFLND